MMFTLLYYFPVCCNFNFIPSVTLHSMLALELSHFTLIALHGCGNEINKRETPVNIITMWGGVCVHMCYMCCVSSQKRYMCTRDKDKQVCQMVYSHRTHTHTSFFKHGMSVQGFLSHTCALYIHLSFPFAFNTYHVVAQYTQYICFVLTSLPLPLPLSFCFYRSHLFVDFLAFS